MNAVVSNYLCELAVAIVVCALVNTLLSILGSPLAYVLTEYEYIVIVVLMVLMVIATIIMFNTARSRVSAAEILEEVQHGEKNS